MAPRRLDANQYFCPSCHLHLITWDPPSRTVEMFHKIALWRDFEAGKVRLVCQYCDGATDVVPDELVDLLQDRFALGSPSTGPRRPKPPA